MARGKRLKNKIFKKSREDDEKGKLEEPTKLDVTKRIEDRFSNRMNTYFKSEEIQEICSLLNVEEVVEYHIFLGAVVIGKFDIVKKLLKDGFPIDYLDENRETALMHAVKNFKLEMVDFLVTRGANISVADSDGNTALLLAAQSNLWDQDSFSGLWQSVSDHPLLSPEHANKAGYTLLHCVTKRQWHSVLEMLLGVPVMLDCVTNRGVTPLIMASSRGDSVFVKALLEAGADISIEDQQKCTALCYAIAFSLQKKITEPNRALELILSAVNDENTKMPLEAYLQRRLELVVNPPKSKTEFHKTVSGVLIHVFTFFTRFVYSGMDLLMELAVFHKLKEAVERHADDKAYTTAVLSVVLELVRHCDCCSQGLSKTELAEAFFGAGLGKSLIETLNRYGLGKTGMIKAVFLPLLFICTSQSYKARSWLEQNHQLLQSYYNKYMRSFPIVFMETKGDPHLEIEKQCSIEFQKLMKTLKTQGKIVTKEEHMKEGQKLKEEETLSQSVYKVLKPNSSVDLKNHFKTSSEKNLNLPDFKRKKSTPSSAVYNSIIQYNFGKLNIIEKTKEASTLEQTNTETKNTNSDLVKENNSKIKKPRIAIKEIQQKQTIENIKSVINNDKPLCTFDKSEEKQRFSEGYQLFQMEEEPFSDFVSLEQKDMDSTCEWMDTLADCNGSRTVSDAEVSSSLQYLQEIFNRIVFRYDSTWKKQYEEGYLDAQGDSEDLLKLMKVLPTLENFHMERLIKKWSDFRVQVQQHARKNHHIYAAMVSEMQLFLLEFEAELEQENVKIFNDFENSSVDSYIDTEKIFRAVSSDDINKLSDGKPVDTLINVNGFNKESVSNTEEEKVTDNNTANVKIAQNIDFVDNIYNSESEDEKHQFPSSIWDGKIQTKSEEKSSSENTVILKSAIDDCSEHTATDNLLGEDIKNVDKIPSEVKIPLKKCFSQENLGEISKIGIFDPNIKKGEEEIISDFLTKTALDTTDFRHVIIKNDQEATQLEVTKGSSPPTKPPPGFEHVFPVKGSCEKLTSVLGYCGTKYQSMTLGLVTLPTYKTDLVAQGSLRMASLEFQQDFKLFTGFNLGDIEFGLSENGMPLAVRRFQKHNTQCNKAIRRTLYDLVKSMLHLKHEYILPYIACDDQPLHVIIAMPLCSQDLGQYIREVRERVNKSRDSLATLTPHLITLAKQVLSGLHYLHTRDKVIVHGNLKPSNVLIDANGVVRLAEFGLHMILFQQQGPAFTSMIWWSQECKNNYHNTWKLLCTQQSDVQTAGMLVHFILTVGHHPFGDNLVEITNNIKLGRILLKTQNVIAMDLLFWMLTHEPDRRPTTCDVLRHVLFWDSDKRWRFLETCCGQGPSNHGCPLPLELLYKDLDFLGKVRDINTKWISILKMNCERKIGSNVFEDTPSGLLKFLSKNLDNWVEMKDIFLELFPVLPLNMFRLLEQTIWIDHPQFEPYTRVDIPSS